MHACPHTAFTDMDRRYFLPLPSRQPCRRVGAQGSIPQGFVQQDDLIGRAGRFFPQDGQVAANALGALAVIAFISLDGAGGLAVQALRIPGRRDVAGAVDGGREGERDLIGAHHEIYARRAIGDGRDAIARVVDVHDLSGFGNAVDGAEVHLRAGGRRARLHHGHAGWRLVVPKDGVERGQQGEPVHLMQGKRAAKAHLRPIDLSVQIHGRLFAGRKVLYAVALSFQVFLQSQWRSIALVCIWMVSGIF